MPRPLPLGALLGVLLLVGLPQAAHASTASVSGSTLTITAAPGEANDVLLSFDGSVGDAAGITAGSGCGPWDESPTKVDCGVDFTAVVIDLGDGNDQYQNSLGGRVATATVDGGAGDDVIFETATTAATIDGGDGDDTIDGGEGNDTIRGGAGNDQLSGRAGNDTIDGGAGVDAVNGDTPANPRHTGNDRILVRDGEIDSVACALGADTVVADADDVVDALDCESVDRSSSAPAPGAGGSGEGGNVSLPRKAKLAAFRAGLRGRVQFSEPASVVIKVRITAATAKRTGLGRRATTLATARVTVLNTSAKRFRLKPSRKVARRLEGVPVGFRATVQVAVKDGSGATARARQGLVLRR